MKALEAVFLLSFIGLINAGSDITFRVYSSRGSVELNTENDLDDTFLEVLLDEKVFNKNNPTVFLVPGHMKNESFDNDPFLYNMRSAYMSKGDYNVIYVCWKYARSFSYERSRENADVAAALLSTQIEDLVSEYDPHYVTITGFSLGAHIAGMAGARLMAKGIQIGRVVGINPSRINIDTTKDKDTYLHRLSDKSGLLVEVVHTDAVYGYFAPLGHIDYYVNGGKDQPGCYPSLDCSNKRAIWYYAEALEHPGSLVGVRCANYEQFLRNECDHHVQATMGADYNPRFNGYNNAYYTFKPGKYYLATNSRSLYGLYSRGTVSVA